MKRRTFFATAGASAISAGLPGLAQASQPKRARSAPNPLLQTWRTPWGVPPFERIRPSHFPTAIAYAIGAHRREIDRIAANPAAPDFQNVIGALEASGETLQRVAGLFFALTGMHSNPELLAMEGDIAARLTAHRTAINQNTALFARIDALYAKRAELGLGPADARLLDRTWKDFVRGGAKLEGPAKERLAEIDGRLSQVQVAFGQNVLAGQSAFALPLRGERDLAGLPESFRAAAKAEAAERGVAADGVVTLSRSSFEPFLTLSTRRDLREAVQKGWMAVGGTPGPHDNRPLIREIVDLRNEKARLLGFPSFAHWRLEDTMAGTPEAAMEMMGRVWESSLAAAKRERDLLQAEARRDGLEGDLQSWDWWLYAERVRKARYDVDEAATKPYFKLDAMVEAIHWHAGALFGLKFAKRTDMPVWHPDVVAYEVSDAAGRPVALWYGDFFARRSKQSGAWMSSFRDQHRIGGREVLPVVYNVCNYAKAPAGQPTLLSLDDVVTLFHEFGHALHGMLSDVTWPSQSGTNVLRDFVEFPSQLMEHWVLTPDILNRFARHHETGEPLPADLVGKIIAAKNFNQGWATTEYLSAAILDMRMHMEGGPAPADVDGWERRILDGIGLIPEIVVRYRAGYFKHTFEGGYAAGYYSYIWAAVLECDAFQAFAESGNLFDPAVSARLKRDIFASGGTRDPMEAYVAFRGRAPGVDALLRDRGLI